MKVKVSYRWHLRQLMATRGMFATSDLVPLLASRGVRLSREQVYRLVAQVPERLSLTTLAALCDIFEVSPGELIEPVRDAPVKAAEQDRGRGVGVAERVAATACQGGCRRSADGCCASLSARPSAAHGGGRFGSVSGVPARQHRRGRGRRVPGAVCGCRLCGARRDHHQPGGFPRSRRRVGGWPRRAASRGAAGGGPPGRRAAGPGLCSAGAGLRYLRAQRSGADPLGDGRAVRALPLP